MLLDEVEFVRVIDEYQYLQVILQLPVPLFIAIVLVFVHFCVLLYVLIYAIASEIFYVFCSSYAFRNVLLMATYALSIKCPLSRFHVIPLRFELDDYI